jgi:hypothetical protein
MDSQSWVTSRRRVLGAATAVSASESSSSEPYRRAGKRRTRAPASLTNVGCRRAYARACQARPTASDDPSPRGGARRTTRGSRRTRRWAHPALLRHPAGRREPARPRDPLSSRRPQPIAGPWSVGPRECRPDQPRWRAQGGLARALRPARYALPPRDAPPKDAAVRTGFADRNSSRARAPHSRAARPTRCPSPIAHRPSAQPHRCTPAATVATERPALAVTSARQRRTALSRCRPHFLRPGRPRLFGSVDTPDAGRRCARHRRSERVHGRDRRPGRSSQARRGVTGVRQRYPLEPGSAQGMPEHLCRSAVLALVDLDRTAVRVLHDEATTPVHLLVPGQFRDTDGLQRRLRGIE